MYLNTKDTKKDTKHTIESLVYIVKSLCELCGKKEYE